MNDPSASESTQLQVAQRLGDLHQLLYTRGGIRPSNAAVEELTKLLLVRIAAERHPDLPVGDSRTLAELVQPEVVRHLPTPQPVKEAFALANSISDLAGQVPGAGRQPVWPADEPLRISRSDVLAEALEVLNAIPLGSGASFDIVGTAFDVFLRGRYEHAGGLGTYLTPDAVVRAMVTIGFDLIDPLRERDGSAPVMGDPCCGSGRFLIGMLQETMSRDPAVPLDVLGRAVVGADQSAASVAMARVNLLAYGLSCPEVFTVDDSITEPSVDRLRGQMRLILTNPPFGDGKYDSRPGLSRTARVFAGLQSKPRIDPSLAFVARCVELLAPGGVAGIILPDGVADGPHMRALLLGSHRPFDEVRLEGVVSLPSATFAPAGTMAKTSVVFIRKGARRSEHVFLARADHVGYVMKKGAVAADPAGDDLPSIAAGVRRALGGASPRSSQVVTADGAGLSSIDAASVDPGALAAVQELRLRGGVPLGAVLRAVKRQRTGLRESLPFVSVLHLDELGNVDWLKAERYRPTTPGLIARGGQLVVSLLNPAKFRAAVIPEMFEEVQCSAEFGIYESNIDPYAALALLQHPSVRAQIAPMGRGTSSSRRRVDCEDVLGLVAPPFDDDWVGKTGCLVRDALEAVAEARLRLTAAYGG